MTKIKIVLLSPPSRLEVYQSLSGDLAAIEPPVWAGLIAEFLRNKDIDVHIIDSEAMGFNHEEAAKEVTKFDPELVVFVVYGQQPSASTQCMPGAAKTANILRKLSSVPTLVMGTHSSALPLRTLQQEPYDFVCQGEGPYTVYELYQYLTGQIKINDVSGLWFKEKGLYKNNPVKDKIKSLDLELPRQALDLLDMSKYRAHNWHCFDDLSSRNSYASLQTSLGCPYKCSFCCINAPFGGAGIRYWTPNNVLEQIDEMVLKYNVKNIKIPDEMFVLNKNHVIEICDGIIERGYKLNIWAYARVDTIKDYYLLKLKKAGFNWLGIGIESGSKFVRDGVEKGRFDLPEIKSIVNKIREHGIYVAANYIFGLPDDTKDTMQETLELALDLNTEWANFYSAMAYPGSPLYEEALSKKIPTPDLNGGPGWIGYSQHAFNCMPLPTETLEYTEVLDFRDIAFNSYFKSSSYLSMIKNKFGDSVVEHVNEMTSYNLPRAHKAG
ncbi:MAG: cobalamin-dependent protein [Methylophilaceae bacterium]|nr:cobalamin-dependent protein [Methylophilaceae bacterium]